MVVPARNDRRERMAALFKDGVPVKKIALRFDVQSPAVWRAIRRAGALPAYNKRESGRGPAPKVASKYGERPPPRYAPTGGTFCAKCGHSPVSACGYPTCPKLRNNQPHNLTNPNSINSRERN